MGEIKFIAILLVLSMLLTVPAFAFFLGLYGCAGGRSQCTRVFLVLAECIFNPILASISIRIAR